MTWKDGMRAIAGAAVALAVVVTAGHALAESKTAKESKGAKAEPPKAEAPAMDAQTKAMMDEMAKYATPGPEHKALEPLIGRWKTVAKAWLGPGEPTVSEGTSEAEWILGGRFLVEKSHSIMMGQPFEGMQLLGFDRKAKTYMATWVDDMGTAIYSMSNGSYDEASKTLTLDATWPDPLGKDPIPYKLRTRIDGPDSHVFTMVSNRGGKEVTEMEITYTRMQ